MTAAALSLLLLFGVAAFGATERWALSILQTGIFALGGLHAWRGRPLPKSALPLALAVAWCGWGMLAGSAADPHAARAAGLEWAGWLVLFVAASEAFAGEGARRRFRLGLVWAGAAISLAALLQHTTAPGRIYWIFPTRAGHSFGPFANPDHHAALMELLIPAAVCAAVTGRAHAAGYAAAAGMMFASIVASGSRAGVAIGAAELLVLPWVLRGRFPGAGRVGAGLAVCAAAATLVVGWQYAWKRFRQDDPFRYRREIAQSTLAMIRERPWTGWGPGSFETVYPAYAGFDIGQRVSHAHNDWLEWTAEGGLPLLGLLAGFAGWSFWRARHTPWTWGAYAVLAHSLVDFPMHIPGVAALVVALLAAPPDSAKPDGRGGLSYSATTGLRSSPMPVTRTTTSSPG